MREVFAPREPADPGYVFYTIRPQDIGKSVIQTEIGPIHVGGSVITADVGKRLYRVLDTTRNYDWWLWQAENDAQFERRTGKADT